ncbi:MAG TPA: nucleotidyltransferase family protein [Thermoplasmata archaeon]|nr:nucleotidyltransferase family protein [Thermoplasmata archaeon]
MKFGAVILAAGASSRMGRCKATLDLGGVSALEMLSTTLRESGTAERIVTVAARPHLDEVKAEAQRLGLGCVINRAPEKGRTGSVQLGLEAVRDSDAAFIAPVDAPLASRADVQSLKDEWWFARQKGGAHIAAIPTCEEKGGHPVLVAREAFGEIAGLAPDEPLRSVFSKDRSRVLRIRCSRGVIVNLDTEEDHRAAVEMLKERAAIADQMKRFQTKPQQAPVR